MGKECEFILRLLIAGICGAVVGYERKSRLKEAGIRTHFIVSMAAALMMIVSKYGFSDLEIGALGIRGADPARIAAQVVSGVGFLGAGMIFVRKHTINGLTTAAGVWATAGIGLSIGAGLYFIGIAATVLIILAQIFLHRPIGILHIPSTEDLRIVAMDDTETMQLIQSILREEKIDVLNIRTERTDDGCKTMDFLVKLPPKFDIASFLFLFEGNEKIKTIDI